ncbi:GNAT family N-acetyltransferase [Sulfobacillus thermosulfidooxidans]|uniref:GNAT family N-acetyltransferase n=1 Tax=Sulfobacillus thermosulfidooxidans TaxID=28034 RepID=UPI0006B65C5B|nr:GNAT family N-acetyltransferase [Sulfobacillus thermosulfidooxidans]
MNSLWFRVRPSTADDTEAIARVQIASWRSTYTGIVSDTFLDHLEQHLDERVESRQQRFNNPNMAIFVLVSPGNHVVGFIDVGPNRDDDVHYDAELYAIYLLKGWQRLGGGRQLVEAATHWLITHHYQALKVWALKENPFRRFYEKLGGSQLSERSITLGTQTFDEVSYGWENLHHLISFLA